MEKADDRTRQRHEIPGNRVCTDTRTLYRPVHSIRCDRKPENSVTDRRSRRCDLPRTVLAIHVKMRERCTKTNSDMPGTCYLTESDDEKETATIQATTIYATVKPSVITASINPPPQTPLPSPITLFELHPHHTEHLQRKGTKSQCASGGPCVHPA